MSVLYQFCSMLVQQNCGFRERHSKAQRGTQLKSFGGYTMMWWCLARAVCWHA